MPSLEISIDSVDFEDTPDEGILCIWDFTGWNDGTSASGDGDDFPDRHGGVDSPVYRGARRIRMAGDVYEPNEANMLALNDQFKGILSDGASAVISVTEFGVTRTATVTLWGVPTFERVGTTGYANWAIEFRAADMRRFGATQPTFGPGASLDVSHAGNFPASPTVIVDGPVSAPYTIASQGHSYVVTQALGTGETHLIDMATGFLHLDGDIQQGAVSAADVFTIPKGEEVTVTGPSSMQVVVVDTYS